MNRPYNKEIIRRMAEHSPECAAYASAMMWDYKRQLTVEKAQENSDTRWIECPFCIHYLRNGKSNLCPLYKIFGACCHHDTKVNLWRKARSALEAKDQQAYTEAANNLYFQIRSIIDDPYKPKVKPEVFYRKGQRFRRNGEEHIMSYTGGMCLVSLKTGQYWVNPITVQEHFHITESEFAKICGDDDTFTLIPDKKN